MVSLQCALGSKVIAFVTRAGETPYTDQIVTSNQSANNAQTVVLQTLKNQTSESQKSKSSRVIVGLCPDDVDSREVR